MVKATDLAQYYEYYESPNKDAANLVCIPGVGCGSWAFRPLIGLLIDHFNLVFINLPGVGNAPAWDEMSVDKIADLIEDICEELKITNTAVLGHSMGGFVAQTLANRGMNISKMVLMSTSYGGTTFDRDSFNLMQKIAKKNWGRRAHVHSSVFYEFIISERTRKLQPHFFKVLRENFGAKAPSEKIIWQHFFCGLKFSNMTKACEISQPCLVVQGAEDNVVSEKSARLLAGQIPQGRYLKIEHAGHLVFLEKIDVLQRIKDYLLGDVVGEEIIDSPKNTFFAQAEESSWLFKQNQLLQFYSPENFDIFKWLTRF